MVLCSSSTRLLHSDASLTSGLKCMAELNIIKSCESEQTFNIHPAPLALFNEFTVKHIYTVHVAIPRSSSNPRHLPPFDGLLLTATLQHLQHQSSRLHEKFVRGTAYPLGNVVAVSTSDADLAPRCSRAKHFLRCVCDMKETVIILVLTIHFRHCLG